MKQLYCGDNGGDIVDDADKNNDNDYDNWFLISNDSCNEPFNSLLQVKKDFSLLHVLDLYYIPKDIAIATESADIQHNNENAVQVSTHYSLLLNVLPVPLFSLICYSSFPISFPPIFFIHNSKPFHCIPLPR